MPEQNVPVDITSVEVPVTQAELQQLRADAILTETGAPWEALRARAKLPAFPFIDWKASRHMADDNDTAIQSAPAVEVSDSGGTLQYFAKEELIRYTHERRGIDAVIAQELFEDFVRQLDTDCALPVLEEIRDSAYGDGYEDGQCGE